MPRWLLLFFPLHYPLFTLDIIWSFSQSNQLDLLNLFILCSFILDYLPLLTILLKMPQTGKPVADSKLGCVQQKISLTCLSSCACLEIPAKEKNMGQQIIDLNYHADSL